MKVTYDKSKKTLLILISSIIITAIVFFVFISIIAKYLIEKYDEKYTGREIEIGWIYVNPLTGYIDIHNLDIYESKNQSTLTNGDSIFFSAKRLRVDFALFKLFSNTLEISKLTLNEPKGIIIQSKENYNFNDLIKRFTPKPTAKPSLLHFNIKKIKIINGTFYYKEKIIPIFYYITHVTIESPGKNWNADTIAMKFSFLSGTGSGSFKGNFNMNFNNMDYQLAVIIQNFNLNILNQYLKEIVNYGQFRATLDADFRSDGNFSDVEDGTNSGLVIVKDFHFGKTKDDDYASFDKLVLAIHEVSPKKLIYEYDSVSITRPYFKYEQYENTDNMQTMFGKNGSNIAAVKADTSHFNLVIEIAEYIKTFGRNFIHSNYKITKLAVYNACLKYNDYTLSEKFSIEINPLTILSDSVDKTRKRVQISLETGIQPYGNMSVILSINPKDSSDFDMQYHLQKLPISMFNPYIINYTKYPFDKGTLELNGTWRVQNGIIKSDNHLLVIDPRVGKRIKNKNTKWVPLPLVMYFIRERGNVIDYEIPITGNLKDPKFHLRDVLIDVLKNIIIKPPTTPYRLEVRYVENEIEQSLFLKWKMRQTLLRNNQERFANKIADFLLKNPKATIAVYPMIYTKKEKEYILFFEAKKKYFLANKKENDLNLSKKDSLKVDKMSLKDSLFLHYLNTKVNDDMLFTIQQKCEKLIGSETINSIYNQLNSAREATFMSYFIKKGVEKQVKMNPAENDIPYNGFSFFRILYRGEFPIELTNASEQMNDLNKHAPRKKFERKREKIRKTM